MQKKSLQKAFWYDFFVAIHSTVRYDWNKWISMLCFFSIHSYWKSFFFYYGKRDLSTAHVSLPITPIKGFFYSRNIIFFVCVNKTGVWCLWVLKFNYIFGVGIIITMLLHRKCCQTKVSPRLEKPDLNLICQKFVKRFLMEFRNYNLILGVELSSITDLTWL